MFKVTDDVLTVLFRWKPDISKTGTSFLKEKTMSSSIHLNKQLPFVDINTAVKVNEHGSKLAVGFCRKSNV